MAVGVPIVLTLSALGWIMRRAHVDSPEKITHAIDNIIHGHPDHSLAQEEVLSLNERLLTLDQDKDVVFCCADGSIGAHKAVLRAASDVLGKLIDQDMQEEDIGMIVLPDATMQVVRVFLRVLYTGLMDPIDWDGVDGDTIPLDILLDVSTLAKRYMVPSISFITTEALKKRLRQAKNSRNVESFQQIWAGALECSLDPVSVLAMGLAHDFDELRKAYNTKSLMDEISFELESIWPNAAIPPNRKHLRFQ